MPNQQVCTHPNGCIVLQAELSGFCSIPVCRHLISTGSPTFPQTSVTIGSNRGKTALLQVNLGAKPQEFVELYHSIIPDRGERERVPVLLNGTNRLVDRCGQGEQGAVVSGDRQARARG
jgi:hypothetical protein